MLRLTVSWRSVSKALLMIASGFDRAGLVRIHPDLAEADMHLVNHCIRRVGLKNAAGAAQQVENEQVRDPSTVGKAPSLNPVRTPICNLTAELGKQPGLADARLAYEAYDSAVPVFDLPQKIVQNRQLALAIDKDRRTRRQRLAQPGAAMGNLEQTISRDRLGLAFEDERPDRLDPSIALRQ